MLIDRQTDTERDSEGEDDTQNLWKGNRARNKEKAWTGKGCPKNNVSAASWVLEKTLKMTYETFLTHQCMHIHTHELQQERPRGACDLSKEMDSWLRPVRTRTVHAKLSAEVLCKSQQMLSGKKGTLTTYLTRSPHSPLHWCALLDPFFHSQVSDERLCGAKQAGSAHCGQRLTSSLPLHGFVI